jgi:hypothetical protein
MGRAERALPSRCIPCRPSSAGGLPVSPLALNDWQSVARQLEGALANKRTSPHRTAPVTDRALAVASGRVLWPRRGDSERRIMQDSRWHA